MEGKKKQKITPKTMERVEFILDNYTNAITPLSRNLLAKKLGMKEKALELFIYRHGLKRQDETRKEYVKQLIEEDILNDSQIKNITKISIKKIKEMRKNV